MTVGEALPGVRKRLEEKALVVATLRDQLSELEERERRGKPNRGDGKRAKTPRHKIAGNTTIAIRNMRDDLAVIGREDLIGPLGEYMKKCFARKDAYKQVNRLFEAEQRRT